MAVFAWRAKQSGSRPADYRTLFVIGISWIPIGLATENDTLWILGIVFIIMGLAKRHKWEADKK